MWIYCAAAMLKDQWPQHWAHMQPLSLSSYPALEQTQTGISMSFEIWIAWKCYIVANWWKSLAPSHCPPFSVWYDKSVMAHTNGINGIVAKLGFGCPLLFLSPTHTNLIHLTWKSTLAYLEKCSVFHYKLSIHQKRDRQSFITNCLSLFWWTLNVFDCIFFL